MQKAHLSLQRRHRLKKSADFQRVRALKQSRAHPLLVLYVAPNGLEFTRIGISTSKRLGKAVVRNRVKRLIRESVRAYLPSLPGGQDLVFIARPQSAGADYRQIKQAVEILLERAHLLSKRPDLEQNVTGAAFDRPAKSSEAANADTRPEERYQDNDEMDRAFSD